MTSSLQIKSGTYYVVFRVPDNEGGTKQKWVNTKIPANGRNKREAKKAADQIVRQYEEAPQTVDYPKMLFSDWIDLWMEQKRSEVDVITYEGYKSYVKNHIKPYFEAKKLALQKITPQDIQNYYNDKIRHDGEEQAKGKLSGKSLKAHHVIIRGSLEDAVKKNIIALNPADRVTLPKKEKFTGNFYTVAQVSKLLEVLDGNVIQPVVALTLFYGMRRSEILGLKWSAINLEENTLEAKATVVRFSKVVEKERTKNNASHRTYPIIPEVREILLRLKSGQERNRKLFGAEYYDNDYVFTWPDGRLFAPDYIASKFSKTLKQNNLPHIRYHDLRHTTASLLLAQGFQLKEIQEWLGHSDIKMTANIYGHLDFDSKKKMANGMGSMLEVSAPN